MMPKSVLMKQHSTGQIVSATDQALLIYIKKKNVTMSRMCTRIVPSGNQVLRNQRFPVAVDGCERTEQSKVGHCADSGSGQAVKLGLEAVPHQLSFCSMAKM
jgi:hypothetical protein